MADALANLVKTGQLKPEPASAEEVGAYLSLAADKLRDAGHATLSLSSRFSLAYDAAHALSFAALRAAGYRPDKSLGHRAVVFQSLPHTVGAPAELWGTLLRYHSKRNASEYGGLVVVTESEVKDIIGLTVTLDKKVRSALKP